MIFECAAEAICPVTGENIVITNLYDAEIGGSCQADISCINIVCNMENVCNFRHTDTDCLVLSSMV